MRPYHIGNRKRGHVRGCYHSDRSWQEGIHVGRKQAGSKGSHYGSGAYSYGSAACDGFNGDGGALTHAIEAYTCKFAQPISDSLAIYAIERIAGSIEAATENGGALDARRDMMLGSLMAGMAFTNSYLGAVHSFSERLGGFYDIPHGIANAIFLPFVTEFNISADYEKHARVARAIWV